MAAISNVNLSNPKTKNSYEKVVSVLRTDTTAFLGCWLPKDASIIGMYVVGAAASDAGTSAVIECGSTTSANEYLASYDVKTAATGEGYNAAGAAAVGSAFMSKLTADTPVYFKYTESGTASNTGGPWYVKIEYTVTGSGETVTS